MVDKGTSSRSGKALASFSASATPDPDFRPISPGSLLSSSSSDLARSYDDISNRISQRLLSKPSGSGSSSSNATAGADLKRHDSWASDRFSSMEMMGSEPTLGSGYRSSMSFSSRDSLNMVGQDSLSQSFTSSNFPSSSAAAAANAALTPSMSRPRKLNPLPSTHGSTNSLLDLLPQAADGSISDSDRSIASMPDTYAPRSSFGGGGGVAQSPLPFPKTLPSLSSVNGGNSVSKLPRMKSETSLAPMSGSEREDQPSSTSYPYQQQQQQQQQQQALAGGEEFSPSRPKHRRSKGSRSRHQSLPEHVAVANIKNMGGFDSSSSPNMSPDLSSDGSPSSARPKAARRRNSKLDSLTPIDDTKDAVLQDRAKSMMAFEELVISLNLAFLNARNPGASPSRRGSTKIPQDRKTTDCAYCYDIDVEGGFLSFGEGDTNGCCISCRRRIMGDFVDMRGYRRRYMPDMSKHVGSPEKQLGSTDTFSEGDQRSARSSLLTSSPHSSIDEEDRGESELDGEEIPPEFCELQIEDVNAQDYDGSTPQPQTSPSKIKKSKSREQVYLDVDITTKLPYLQYCVPPQDALARYGDLFLAVDADCDGLLNLNQLHHGVSLVNFHQIGNKEKDYTVSCLFAAQVLMEAPSPLLSIRPVNYKSFAVIATLSERILSLTLSSSSLGPSLGSFGGMDADDALEKLKFGNEVFDRFADAKGKITAHQFLLALQGKGVDIKEMTCKLEEEEVEELDYLDYLAHMMRVEFPEYV